MNRTNSSISFNDDDEDPKSEYGQLIEKTGKMLNFAGNNRKNLLHREVNLLPPAIKILLKTDPNADSIAETKELVSKLQNLKESFEEASFDGRCIADCERIINAAESLRGISSTLCEQLQEIQLHNQIPDEND